MAKEGLLNANIFHKRVVEESADDNLFKVLLQEFDYQFFSHLHDIGLWLLPKEEVVGHFYDYFGFLCKGEYEGEHIAASYRSYYKELSKINTGVQAQFWRLLYSFYVHLERSAELRAVRFALEKARGKDLVEFLLKVKEMTAAILSLPVASFFMDAVSVQPIDLAQIFSAVYDGRAVSKMHLLASIQNRCDSNGICAGEFAAMLLVDFVKTREHEPASPQANLKKMDTDLEAESSPPRPQTERKTGTEWHTKPKTYSERKATAPADARRQQKTAMMSARSDLIEQVNYLTQEKNRAEDRLISSVALLKKNVKDYNELLLFSTQLAKDFATLYENLKAAPKDPSKRLPFGEKTVAPYKALLSAETKNMRKELKGFVLNTREDEVAFPLVSSPNKYHSTGKKVSDVQTK